MAFKYYDQKLSYIMADILVNTFSFNILKEPLKNILEEVNLSFNLEIEIKLQLPTRESPLIEDFYNKGEIRSHEVNELIKLITMKIINGFQLKTSYLLNSLTRFYRFKNSLKISLNKTIVSTLKTNFTELRIGIEISNLKRFTAKLIFAIVSEFKIDFIGYCEKVQASISKIKGNSKNTLFSSELKIMSLKESSDFLTLDDKEMILEFFGNPDVKDILFAYFFPEGFDKGTITEITWDRLRSDSRAQKRRRIIHQNGKYENIHDVINEYTNIEEFKEIINRNDLCSFYASIRTCRKRYLCTAIIDIDTSYFLRSLISPQTLWKFTLILSKEIIKTCSSLGLENPLVVFSGKRGLHLLWRIPGNLIRDDYKYTHLWETFLLPAQKSLVNDPKSALRSKFGLIKKIFEGILLDVSYNFDIEKIPQEIRTGLGLTRASDLFKISPFSDHVIGILLDTSTLNGSVHRVFSFHFASRLISIPLTDPKTREIYAKYENYETVLEESKSSFVLENLKKGNKEQYYQKPTIISLAQIRRILSPDAGLLPVIAMIVRFSERFVTERSTLSYKFWIEYFELTTCYDFISNKLLRINIQECDTETFRKISKIVDNCSIELKPLVKDAIKNFLHGKVSFLVLKTKLDALKDFEFFFRLKSDAIKPISLDVFKDLIENTNMRSVSQLIRSFSKFFMIVQVWLCYILDHLKLFESDENRKKAINKLFFRLQSFRELMEENPVKLKTNKEKEKRFDLLYLILLHNIYTRFLKDFFLFKSRYGGKK